MTTPAATQVPQQPPPQRAPTDAVLIEAILAALGAYYTAKALVATLRVPFRAAGIGGAALAAAVSLALSWPHEPMEGTGPATRWAVRVNTLRRAQFALAASRRVQTAIDVARSRDVPWHEAARAAAAVEQRWLNQHVAASTQRVQAASAVDGMAAVHGNLLSWNAVRDSHVTAGCLAADKKNFRADRPPIIEGHPAFPGAVHGSTCRCTPGPPRRGAPLLPSS